MESVGTQDCKYKYSTEWSIHCSVCDMMDLLAAHASRERERVRAYRHVGNDSRVFKFIFNK
jgi:hypothetical protein